MKKQTLLLSFLFITCISFGQKTISGGVSAGVISAGMNGEAVDNFKSIIDLGSGYVSNNNRTGFYAGGHISIPLDKTIYIEPGAYYSQKGYEIKGNLNIKGTDFINAKSQLQLNYLDLPLLLKADLNGFQIFAGPQFSYLLNADIKSSAGILGFNLLNNTMDVTGKFNRWDMGFTGGIGYRFTNGIRVSASYDQGLSKIDANKNYSTYNHAIKVGLGINF